jgi:hypothetical protein
MTPAVAVPAAPTAPPVQAGPRYARRALVVAGCVVASWLAAGLAQWARVDWVLLVVAVVALAGLLRGGHGPVARFALALALLYAITCVAGMLFSVWPWHLNPVPIAGLGLTVLALGYGITGRRFSLPRPRRDDVTILAGTAAVAGVVLWPMLRRNPSDRLALFMHVEDFLRHMLMYDTVRVGGGYLFLHEQTAIRQTGGIGFNAYPTGSHFVFGVTENFLRSTTTPGPAGVWADDYLWMHAAAYIGMALAVLWAARHVAGAAAAGWRSVPMLAVVTAALAFGPPIRIFDRGYPQETTALALLAVLAAVLVRPLRHTREQLVLVAALLAGVSFSYYLFLPVAGVMAAGWLVADHRRVLRRWPFLIGAAAAGLSGAAVIPYRNWEHAPPGQVLLQHGQVAPIPDLFLYGLVALALIGCAVLLVRGRHGARVVQRLRAEQPRAGVRSAARRVSRRATGLSLGWVGLIGLLASLTFVLAVGWYQRAHAGADYFDIKLKHQLMVMCLVMCGGLARLAGTRGPALAARLPVVLRRIPAGAAATALGLLIVVAYGGAAPIGAAPGRTWAHGRTSERPAAGEYAYLAYAAYPKADGTRTMLLVDSPWSTYLSTVYLGIFQHAYPTQYLFAYSFRPWTGAHPLSQWEQRIAESDLPVRVYSDDPATRQQLTAFAATLPPGKLTVFDAATLR